MPRTISDRITESAEHGFVGRKPELGALVSAALAEEPPFLVAFVHGPGGIGKSRLVHRLLTTLLPKVRALYVDGRHVEPTPEGFCRALAAALGLDPSAATALAIAQALGPTPTTLVVDTYESLGLLDTWLRTRFLPTLPATTLTILSGRDRPTTAWHTTAGWPGLVAEFPLSALSRQDAAALLRSRGLDEAQAAWADEFAKGHPLAIEPRRPPSGPTRPARRDAPSPQPVCWRRSSASCPPRS